MAHPPYNVRKVKAKKEYSFRSSNGAPASNCYRKDQSTQDGQNNNVRDSAAGHSDGMNDRNRSADEKQIKDITANDIPYRNIAFTASRRENPGN